MPSYTLHYASADGPGDATWSVYREQYASIEDEDPIDGSQEYVSTHADEVTALAVAVCLQIGVPDLEDRTAVERWLDDHD